jgi:hypothetical protein
MYTIFAAVLRHLRKSDVVTSVELSVRSAVYYEAGSPLLPPHQEPAGRGGMGYEHSAVRADQFNAGMMFI